MSQSPTEEALISPATLLRYFRYLGWAEGGSLLLLMLVAMPLKYIWGYPLAVRIVGSAHGFLFLVYVLASFQVASALRWSPKILLLALIGSVFPFGTFIFDWKYLAHRSDVEG